MLYTFYCFITSGWILVISLHNLHACGVGHPDKILLLGDVGRRQVIYLIEETMPIASLALERRLDACLSQNTLVYFFLEVANKITNST